MEVVKEVKVEVPKEVIKYIEVPQGANPNNVVYHYGVQLHEPSAPTEPIAPLELGAPQLGAAHTLSDRDVIREVPYEVVREVTKEVCAVITFNVGCGNAPPSRLGQFYRCWCCVLSLPRPPVLTRLFARLLRGADRDDSRGPASITPWDTQTGPQKLVEHITSILADPAQCVDSKVNAAACTEYTNNKNAYDAKA